MTDQAQQTQQSPINLGTATVETGELPQAARKPGAFGPRGSKYDSILDQIPGLPKSDPANKQYTFIRVELKGSDADKAIGAIRVAAKRKYGKEITESVKLRKGENDTVLLFRV